MLRSRGAALVACGDLRALPEAPRQGLPVGVSIAVALDRQIVRDIRSGPTAAYFAEYQRVNGLLNELATAAGEFLRSRGHRAAGRQATVGSLMDLETLSTPLPHKTVATRAGLGWIGKTALLITREYGAAVRLTSVLTDAPLPTARPVDESQCGACEECAAACPAQASRRAAWKAGMERAELYDAFACRQKARELSARVGVSQSICGICIRVCPWTTRYLDGPQPSQDSRARDEP